MGNVRELMTERPTTCDTSAPVVDAAKLMAKEDIGPIPVVESDRLVGLVTDRDIAIRVVAEGRDPQSTTVGEIASKDLVTVSPDDDLEQALTLMARRQVRRLPVVEGERVVGIVAQADVARHLDETRTGEVVEEISKK
jgi:CBS domain-containing protein